MFQKMKCIIGMILLVIDILIIILLVNIINDLKLTANGYESDRNICRRENEEIIENYQKLEEKYNEISKEK